MTLSPLAILLLLHIPFVSASLPNLNGTSVPTLDVSNPLSCSNTRSLWDIIWSCAATLFACTWTAIHPNIPGMDEGKFAVYSRRLGIMMMGLIAPELVITWATVQFLSARDTAKAFNDVFGAQLHQTRSCCADMREIGTATSLPASLFREWTVTHGFFVWMGGFMLYFDDKPRATLTPNELKRFVHEGSVEMPIIMEADIEDRSKGDALSKGIAILQLAWFVLQLVARYVQNLPVTLLELDTLAIAALSGIAYGFWWKKPKDVGRPHVVYWKATASPPSILTYDNIGEKFSENFWSDLWFTCVYPWMSLMSIEISVSPRAVHSRRVPSQGGYKESNRHDGVRLLIGCFSGAVFGGLHCLGWNVLFQGHAEQMLWRAASLAIASAPVFILLSYGYIIWLDGLHQTIVACTVLSSACVYIVARVTLIVLILMGFRSLPPGVYDTVAWTKLIPHL
ncbi:uncharacterized protein F5147DRAFT_713644 [Suillus discolor]|uniref:Uncharacterized protein n=1 Tax=Suillus discolor TaxID=1912936 RepID=A0A9P7F058_9AGAM|nr:uncharacterized protein F5147DRAFT_713644 [Suillus discolor]KAG2098745.1 hypothetical protein F5147DRAFT_713644 [Suillus discolor]